ncbi:hypothetical protein [Oceanidesulfovibrio marinus]|uniref:DUF3137 domain-containing protein n=1 Tax=Oceanidesulfovibrio marinus TaxID=370038 RepID=A0A6P1ZEW9_9BACT|nr:hypothetical protein [Oceanidesulfovibrio marinus]TVM32482.1 hypothetical protein DQK91_14485 [Oceanidesulfovibrio marinus]
MFGFGKRYAPRVHGAALDALRRTAGALEGAGLGPFEETGENFEFAPGQGGARSLRLTWEQKKKFMGGVYRTVLEAEFDSDVPVRAPLVLHYGGALFKGAPEFKNKKQEAAEGAHDVLADLLNQNKGLVDLLFLQDIEKMTLEPGDKDGTVRMRLAPVGGSFVWMLMPPMKYAVKLPAKHGAAMVETVNVLARLLGHGAAVRDDRTK